MPHEIPDKGLSKAEIVDMWESVDGVVSSLPFEMAPIPYRHEGSTAGLDGLRISGSLATIKGFMSLLKPLLAKDCGSTRLQISLKPIFDKQTGQRLDDCFFFYVQVCARAKSKSNVCAAKTQIPKALPTQREKLELLDLLPSAKSQGISIDDLAGMLGEPVHSINAQLLSYELAGQIERLQGMRFRLK